LKVHGSAAVTALTMSAGVDLDALAALDQLRSACSSENLGEPVRAGTLFLFEALMSRMISFLAPLHA